MKRKIPQTVRLSTEAGKAVVNIRKRVKASRQSIVTAAVLHYANSLKVAVA